MKNINLKTIKIEKNYKNIKNIKANCFFSTKTIEI